MQTLISLISAHPYTALVAGFAIYNAMVQAMEEPNEHDGRLYRYIYRLGHGLAFNFQYALRAKFPDYVPDVAKKPDVK